MSLDTELKHGFDWAILFSVLLVVSGHIIGTMITDNYYFVGIKPVIKDASKAVQIV